MNVMSNARHPTTFFQSRGRRSHIYWIPFFRMVAKMEKPQVWRMNCMDVIILGCVLLRTSRIFCIFYCVGRTPSYLDAYCCAIIFCIFCIFNIAYSITDLFIWEFFNRQKQCVIRRIFVDYRGRRSCVTYCSERNAY